MSSISLPLQIALALQNVTAFANHSVFPSVYWKKRLHTQHQVSLSEAGVPASCEGCEDARRRRAPAGCRGSGSCLAPARTAERGPTRRSHAAQSAPAPCGAQHKLSTQRYLAAPLPFEFILKSFIPKHPHHPAKSAPEMRLCRVSAPDSKRGGCAGDRKP